MSQDGVNSFFKFVLGFTVFIGVSFGLTYAVTTYAVEEGKERQVSAAFQAMLGEEGGDWWLQVPLLDKLGF